MDTERKGTDTAGAGDTMVFVTVSETYDLSTKANKMSLIGIHTPTKEIIQKTYPGLCVNSRFCRVVKQDVVLACASQMPFSADIVGTGADDIAPEDAFNPILYKAVSNESMSTLEYRLRGLASALDSNLAIKGSQAVVDNDNVTEIADEFNTYYALLSDHSGFKTANPQQGLQMRGLVPLVFERYYSVGSNSVPEYGDSALEKVIESNNNALAVRTLNLQSMRGKAHPMPRFNTTYLTSVSGSFSAGLNVGNGMGRIDSAGDSTPYNAQAQMPDIMPVYTACIVMPPSRLHTLYYRMVVRTTLEFTEVRPIQEIASFASLSADYAPIVYHSDYAEQSKQMTAIAGMVDAQNAEINKIMEGA